ncbi:MAG: hypothetical protein LBK60_04210 [Verrucomicrobiales bacterium]|nr:hypothetical protein [Verrucomicrobiales bacterium]
MIATGGEAGQPCKIRVGGTLRKYTTFSAEMSTLSSIVGEQYSMGSGGSGPRLFVSAFLPRVASHRQRRAPLEFGQ